MLVLMFGDEYIVAPPFVGQDTYYIVLEWVIVVVNIVPLAGLFPLVELIGYSEKLGFVFVFSKTLQEYYFCPDLGKISNSASNPQFTSQLKLYYSSRQRQFQPGVHYGVIQ